jgi:hypothetical protein
MVKRMGEQRIGGKILKVPENISISKQPLFFFLFFVPLHVRLVAMYNAHDRAHLIFD